MPLLHAVTIGVITSYSIHYTKLYERVDLHKLRADRGDVAYAVPSPERRSSGNWVLPAVPLVKSGS